MIPFVSAIRHSGEVPPGGFRASYAFQQRWARITFLIIATVGLCLSITGMVISQSLLLDQHRVGGPIGISNWAENAGASLICISLGMGCLAASFVVWVIAVLNAKSPQWLVVIVTTITFGTALGAGVVFFFGMKSYCDDGDDDVVFDMNNIHIEMAKQDSVLSDDAGGF